MMDSYRSSRDLMGAYPASLKTHSFLGKTHCSKNLDLCNGLNDCNGWKAVWRFSGSGQQKRTFAIPRELADSRMGALVKRGDGPLWQADTTLGLHEASPARSEFGGPASVRLFEKFGGNNAICPEVAEVLTKLAPRG
jgi:hypothetical protein